MKKLLLSLTALSLIIISCKKSSDDGPSGGGSCAPDASICFKLGDTVHSFKASWYSILGGGKSFSYGDSLIGFGMDVGSSDIRDFALNKGSLWSGAARMNFRNKKTGIQYDAISGTVSITANNSGLISGSFHGTAKNFSSSNPNDTLLITEGTLTSVAEK
ncbi:MAG: hypothetical protein JST36_00825 [Bacteroidetes bacterium]|nr:hypothetical protein [Bacteroidota bacterium]